MLQSLALPSAATAARVKLVIWRWPEPGAVALRVRVPGQTKLPDMKQIFVFSKNFLLCRSVQAPILGDESRMTGMDSRSGQKIGTMIRNRRRQLHLTLQQLGEKSGVSYSYLSQVERDNASPTLGTLAQVAIALGVGIDYFVATPRPSDALTRAASREKFAINGSSIQYERLGAEFPGTELSSFVMHVPPGFHSETVSHVGEEIIYVLEGAITQVVDGTTFHLTQGDSLHYRGTSPHSYCNDSDAPTRILWSGNLQLFHTPGAAAFSPPSRQEPSQQNIREQA